MKFYVGSIMLMVGAIVLFVMGTLWSSSFLMITMCPSAIIFIWLNGFAFNRAGITISAQPPQKTMKRQAPKQRQQQNALDYN